ncbi:hypothetical protein CDD81_3937 [Ophiocordyceps australis]|uniref:Uncharacterized protein n=1 Tax=Ophiocordyceps australis TaxID=1399860 RepID=A0A2C5XWE0_9HYPO|nr:hypothetical protein CDD81_3937 [Ophiocordyceps australis]
MDGEDGECKTRGRDADTRDSSTRILLLLAVKNADKAPQPASFPVRLSMMTALAEALQQDTQLGIDIGVTRLPYFHDKARGIGESGLYDVALEQVYLAGYDTLVRVFDEKYYGVGRESTEGNMTLGKRGRMKAALDTFFQSAVLQVFLRPDDGWGSIEEQRDWLRAAVDARWAERILIVEGEDLAGVSSSRVRNKVKMGGQLDGLVDDGVKWWIEQEKLYQ